VLRYVAVWVILRYIAVCCGMLRFSGRPGKKYFKLLQVQRE
jgi:hypothetical protein